MSARDKLAEIINEYMEVDIPESVPDKHIPTGADYGLADEIIEAGWRPPMRVIETVEELEALPNNEERAIPQEAVEAAAKAIQEHWAIYGRLFKCCSCGYVAPEKDQAATQASVEKHIVEISLTAALPVIEKEIRTQIAAEMKRRDNDYLKFANRFGGYYMGLQSAFHEAARIAEGADHA